MRKILFWIFIGFVLFAALVAVIFTILSRTEQETLADTTPIQPVQSKKVSAPLEITARDSMLQIINQKDSIVLVQNQKIDSLYLLLQTRADTIRDYRRSIQQLKQSMENYTTKGENIKNLAKSYEAMRIDEMKPILEKIDNQTIIKIYQQMSSRKQMKILQALSAERAAQITRQLTQ